MDLQIWGFGEPLSKEKLTLLCLLGEASLPLTAFLAQIAHSGLSLQNNCLKIGREGRTLFIRLSLGEPSQKGLLQGQSHTKIAPNLSEPSFYCCCPSIFTCLLTVCFLSRPHWHHSETCLRNKLRLQESQLLLSHLSHRNTTPAEFCSLYLIIFVRRTAGTNPMMPSTKPSPPESPRVRPTYSEEEMDASGTTTASRGTPCPKGHKPSLFPSRSSRDGAEKDTKLLHEPRNPAQLETGLKYSPGGAWGWWRPQVRLLGAVKAQKCPQGYLAPGMSAKAPFCGKSCLLAGQESAWAYKNWKSAWEAFPPALKATKTSAKEWHPLGFVSPMVRAGGGPVLQDILTR